MNFLLDEDGDLAIVNNNWVMVEGQSEILQIIKCNLQAVAGEWFLDQTLGLPWFDVILEKQNSGANIDAIFIDAIKNSDGVLSITRFASGLDAANRVLLISFECLTSDGIVEFSGQIAPGGTA